MKLGRSTESDILVTVDITAALALYIAVTNNAFDIPYAKMPAIVVHENMNFGDNTPE